MLFTIDLKAPYKRRYHNPHFTDREAEVLKGDVTAQVPTAGRVGIESRFPAPPLMSYSLAIVDGGEKRTLKTER